LYKNFSAGDIAQSQGTRTSPDDANGDKDTAGSDYNDPTHFLSGTGSLHAFVDQPASDTFYRLWFTDPPDLTQVASFDVWIWDAVTTEVNTPPSSDLNLRCFFSSDAPVSLANYFRADFVAGGAQCRVRTKPGWRCYRFFLNTDDVFTAGSPTWETIQSIMIEVDGFSGQIAECWIDSVYLNMQTRAKILWTNDDGATETYSEFYNYIASVGQVGTAYMSSHIIEGGSQTTLSQAQEMYAAGFDIGNHSSAGTSLGTIPANEGIALLNTCAEYLENNGMPRAARHVAYPQGSYTLDLIEAMKTNNYKTGRLAAQASKQFMNQVGHPDDPNIRTDDIWVMTMIPVKAAENVATIKAYIDKAVSQGGVILLMTHRILASGATGDDYNRADFQELVDYTVTKQQNCLADIVTVSDWYDTLTSPRLTTDRVSA